MKKRLREAIGGLDETFTEEEIIRNSLGPEIIFAHAESPLGEAIKQLPSGDDAQDVEIDLDGTKTQIFGSISRHEPSDCLMKGYMPSPLPSHPNLTGQQALCATYTLPKLPLENLESIIFKVF